MSKRKQLRTASCQLQADSGNPGHISIGTRRTAFDARKSCRVSGVSQEETDTLPFRFTICRMAFPNTEKLVLPPQAHTRREGGHCYDEEGGLWNRTHRIMFCSFSESLPLSSVGPTKVPTTARLRHVWYIVHGEGRCRSQTMVYRELSMMQSSGRG